MTAAQPVPAALSPKAAQVLGAAKTVFLRDGFERTSMDAVAREAGVSKATLYAHFASKERLFAAVVGGECTRHVHVLEAVEAERLPIEAALRKIARSFVDFLQRPDVIAVHRLVIGESHRFPELGRAFYEAGPTIVQHMLAEFLGRAAARGELALRDPAIAAELFLSMVKGHFQLRTELGYAAAPEGERDRLVREAVDLFVSGYRPSRAPA